MRAVDTNILVRYVVNDDPKQVPVVERLFGQCQASQESVFIPVLILCELIWVLDRLYAPSKLQLIETLEKLLALDLVPVQSGIRCAPDSGTASPREGDLSAVFVIGEISRQAGCRDIVSFDRDLRGSPGFSIL
jgi:predicted nucleic-acid-binding protein